MATAAYLLSEVITTICTMLNDPSEEVYAGQAQTQFWRAVNSLIAEGLYKPEDIFGYLASTGSEKVANGDFTGNATGWTLGGNWAYATNLIQVAVATAGDAEQDISSVAGELYRLTYTMTRTAGTLTPQIGSVDGRARTASGVYVEYIQAADTGNLKFQADGSFLGTVDNVSVKKATFTDNIDSKGLITLTDLTDLDKVIRVYTDPQVDGQLNRIIRFIQNHESYLNSNSGYDYIDSDEVIVWRDGNNLHFYPLDHANVDQIAISSENMTFTATAKTIVQDGDTADYWSDLGYAVGDVILIDKTSNNDGEFTINTMVDATLTVDETVVDEASIATDVRGLTGVTIEYLIHPDIDLATTVDLYLWMSAMFIDRAIERTVENIIKFRSVE